MDIQVAASKVELGRQAASLGAEWIKAAIAEKGVARVIVATGASQFETLDALIAIPDLPWHRVECFHLDEYVGMPITHPASFRKYLWERLHRQLPAPPRSFCYIDGEGDPQAECERAGALIAAAPVDVCFAGIGENGHLAFNDPPADFETETPYLVVNLDEACRRQQMGEGWFPTLDDVPTQAISMGIRQIMQSAHIILAVPDERKREAVRNTVEGPIEPACPASIVQQHPSCHLFLDRESAALLRSPQSRNRA